MCTFLGENILNLKVLSLNLWNINEPYDKRMRRLISGIQKSNYDVCVFQEVSIHRGSNDPQSQLISDETNLRFHVFRLTGKWKGRKEGLAIISRFPLRLISHVQLPEAPNDMPRQLLVSRVKVGSRSIILANTHLAYPMGAEVHREKQVHMIKEYLDKLLHTANYKNQPLVLCGDFNATPESKSIDQLSSGDIRLVDTFSDYRKQNRKFTFSSANPFSDPQLGTNRWIDYIFVSKECNAKEARLIFDGTEEDHVSDHYGLECIVQIDA